MKRIIFLIALILIFAIAFSADISLLGGMELSGKSRQFIGARLAFLDSLIGVSFDAYLPVSSFQSSTEEVQNAKFLELDPYILLNLPLGDLKVYAGVAPIIIVDIQNIDFNIFSTSVFHAKAGITYGKGISFFVDGITTFSTKLESTGIYSVSAGIGLSF